MIQNLAGSQNAFEAFFIILRKYKTQSKSEKKIQKYLKQKVNYFRQKVKNDKYKQKMETINKNILEFRLQRNLININYLNLMENIAGFRNFFEAFLKVNRNDIIIIKVCFNLRRRLVLLDLH